MLIIGGSGFVGTTLISYASNDFDLHVTINKNEINQKNIPITRLDLIQDRNALANLIKKINPDIVINTAAHSNVDLCETDHDVADLLHVEIIQDIADICAKTNSKLIHFSTDFVFNSPIKKKFLENDIPSPVNYYGKTRLEAEKIVLNKSPKNVILRTAVIFGWHKKSRFTDWIISSLQQNKSIDPHVDQYNTPTLVDDLCKAIVKLSKLDISGLYHATGKTCLSRFEFAQALATGFNLEKNLIKPVTSQEKKQIATRPSCSCLDSSKLEQKIGFNFSEISEAISFMYKKSKKTL